MTNAVLEAAPAADALVMAAAVADYRPAAPAGAEDQEAARAACGWSWSVPPTSCAGVAERRGRSGRPRVVVGFAAETQDLVANARDKLTRKGLDLIVANPVPQSFGGELSQATLLPAGGAVEELPVLPKAEVAERILDVVVGRLAEGGNEDTVACG